MGDKDIIIGIDLGTTNSCVAVPKGGGEVEVIVDSLGRRTLPSVVAEDDEGNIIVGYQAKLRAGMKPSPIDFVKRSMGTDNKFKLHGKDRLPEEISAEILKALKKQAEDYLKTEVKRAVITVPAYFDLGQKNATRKAAELAGFEIEEENILQEPVAAALAYSLQDERENLRIMTYDLGGGTFDVAILEKVDGEPQPPKHFGGDPFLGGYDFDKVLANYILKKLKEKGYRLDLNFEDAEDSARWATLMFIAEKTKIELSDSLETPIRKPEVFEDHKGEPVNINMSVTRKEFEGLINPRINRIENGEIKKRAYIDETIEHCKTTLQKSGLSIEEIDEIVMVGGSSYIPLAQQSLKVAFGKESKLIEREDILLTPDTCVAIGAALKARTLGLRIRGLKLEHYPSVTSEDTLPIGGKVLAKELPEGIELSDGKITISRGDGGFEKTEDLSQDGGFIFEDVELLEDTTNIFTLSVTDKSGNEILSHTFKITHRPGVEGKKEDEIKIPVAVLSKPIYVMLKEGFEIMADEGELLPVVMKKIFKTTEISEKTGRIEVPIYEEDREIGKIEIKGLKVSAETPVEVTVEFKENFEAVATTYIPSLKEKKDTTFNIPPIPVPPLEKMKEDWRRLKDEFWQALEVKGKEDPNLKIQYQRQGEKLIEEIENAFAEKPPERPKIVRMLMAFRGLIKKITTVIILNPPKSKFDEKVDNALKLEEEKSKKFERVKKEGYREQILAFREQGEKAFERKDENQWSEANKKIDEVIVDLENIGKEGWTPPPPQIFAIQLKLFIDENIRNLTQEARGKNMQAELNELKKLKKEADDVDISNPEDACAKFLALIHTKLNPLTERITGEEVTVKCENEKCGYTDVMSVFINNEYHCPKCGSIIHVLLTGM